MRKVKAWRRRGLTTRHGDSDGKRALAREDRIEQIARGTPVYISGSGDSANSCMRESYSERGKNTRRRRELEGNIIKSIRKERSQGTEQRMAESEWARHLLKELREMRLGITEEIRQEGKKIRRELDELRMQVERIERRQPEITKVEEAERQKGRRRREDDEEEGREREEEGRESRERHRGGKLTKERLEDEREESSSGGWSDGGWGRDLWDEDAHSEEGRGKERKNPLEKDIREEDSKEELGTKKRTRGPDELEKSLTSVKEGRSIGGKDEAGEDKRRTQDEDKEKELEAEKNRLLRLMEEREEEVRRRREWREREEQRKAEREKRERTERRKRNLIWRRVIGNGPKERMEAVETIMERVLGRIVPVRKMFEVKGADKKEILFVELEEEEDKEDIIERSEEIWRRWEVGVDEEMTMEERAYRHRLEEKAREKRVKGRSAVVTNKRLWIDGREVKWEEDRNRWKRI